MKFALVSVALTVSLLNAGACSASSLVHHYPVTRGSELVSSMPSFDGHLVAVEIRVTEIALGAYGKPYIRAEFVDGTSPLWLAPLVDVAAEVAVGDIIRVMGYVAKISGPQGDLLKSRNPHGFHLLVICYYNFRTEQGLFFPFAQEPNQCTQWRDGESLGSSNSSKPTLLRNAA